MRANALLLGSQTPTLLCEPAGAVDFTLGVLAVEWAESIAGYGLYPWQRDAVRRILCRRPDGLWAARDAVLEVTRQQGKNVVLEVIELFLVFCVGARLIVHSAHRADTSAEHFLRLREMIEGNTELMAQMPTSKVNNGFTTANGKEAIQLKNGARILFKARQSNAGRGPSPQVIVVDEAFDCSAGAIGSLAPSLTAQRNPLILFASSAPKASSLLLHDLQKRAVEADPADRLLYLGWRSLEGVDPESDAAIAAVSPSLGLGRVTLESIRANKRLLRTFPGEFEREHLGVAEMPLDAEHGPIPLDVWLSIADPSSTITSHRQWSLAVSPDLRWSAVSIAGRRADGRLHVEWMIHRPGTGWIVDEVVKAWVSKRIPLRIHKSAPEAAFAGQLRERGVEVVDVSSAEVAQATGQLIDAAMNDGLRHLGQPSLDRSLAGAARRQSVDGASTWSQIRSSVEITPLMAATVALGGVPTEVPALLFAY